MFLNAGLRAEKTPIGQYVRQYNSLTMNEVTIFIVCDEIASREMIFHRRYGDVYRVSEIDFVNSFKYYWQYRVI